MSKNPKESSVINVDNIAEGANSISQGVAGLLPLTKTKKSLTKVLADQNAAGLLARTMAAFVHIDMKFESGMRSMGQVLHNLLKMPEDVQRKAIGAICDAQNIPAIEETGRKGLAMALYAKFPEMLQISGKNKDTKAGMRISSYIASYKLSLPPAPGGRSAGVSANGAGGGGVRTAKDLFLKLYTSGTNKDQAVLVRLAGRAGIKYEDWLPEPDEAGSPNEDAD